MGFRKYNTTWTENEEVVVVPTPVQEPTPTVPVEEDE